MIKYVVLYNQLSGNGTGRQTAEALEKQLSADEVQLCDVTEIASYKEFFADRASEERILLLGGDGTLNRFVNDTANVEFDNEVFYFPAGTGNDFLRDITGVADPSKVTEPLCITKYLKDLPKVTVKGVTYRYLNGVGYGIDGYCCEVGDDQKAAGVKDINYTAIAIKGLLFHYKPCNAVITVDGVRHEFKKVWLAPTMNGRYYGGGMMAAPNQERLNGEHTQSVMLFYGKGPLLTLMAFPKIFSGEHVNTKLVQILTGKQIKVEFDSPRALQVDGETIKSVSMYEVNA